MIIILLTLLLYVINRLVDLAYIFHENPEYLHYTLGSIGFRLHARTYNIERHHNEIFLQTNENKNVVCNNYIIIRIGVYTRCVISKKCTEIYLGTSDENVTFDRLHFWTAINVCLVQVITIIIIVYIGFCF